MKRDDFLEVAERIAQRIASQAIWSGSFCTWQVQVADRSDASRSQPQNASGLVYQGTSGIAFFLAELARVTADTGLARAAEGGLRHALATGRELPESSFGFHTGRVGISWVAARMARLLGKAEYLDSAWQLLEPLCGNEFHDQGLDVISGAAGAIPALLELGTALGRDEPLESARCLGEHLIERAHREPEGWSWAMMTNTVARHLNGLAHGAAGAGLALLELARATGETRFCFAAEMAFLYERRFFEPRSSNWPDLRNNELGKFLFYEGQREELVQRARAGTLPVNQRAYMTAWCHGSPGIGLSRLRAFELTGQEVYRRETEAAVASTLEAVADHPLEHEGFSLCHGIAGNCTLLLAGAALLAEPAWRERVVEVASHGWERYEKAERPWPCGTVNNISDPSLLVGEAGIGMFYLRFAEPEIPSPLLLRPEHRDPPSRGTAAGYTTLAREAADNFFRVSRRATERLTSSTFWTPPRADGEPLLETPAESLHTALRRLVEAADGELHELLNDACRVERERWEASRALDDFTAEFVRGLTHAPWDEIAPEQARFERAPESRLLAPRRDWQRWADEDSGITVPPPEEETHVLLYRQGNRIHPQPVGVFAALLLEFLEQPATLEVLVDRVAGSLESPIERQSLTLRVLPQLEALYRAGFVVAAAPRQTAPRQTAPHQVETSTSTATVAGEDG